MSESPTTALPAYLTTLLASQYAPDDVERICAGLAAQRVVSLRANTLLATRDEVAATLEETGLTLGKVCCRGVVHFRSDTWEDEEMYLYTSEEFSGELDENCAEGTLAWIPEDQVMSLPMWEGDRLFLPELLEGAAAIEMTVVYEGDRLKAWY